MVDSPGGLRARKDADPDKDPDLLREERDQLRERLKKLENVAEAAAGHRCPNTSSTEEHEVCNICVTLDALKEDE